MFKSQRICHAMLSMKNIYNNKKFFLAKMRFCVITLSSVVK